jgi:DNA-binding transcriptional regulator YiaG
MKKTKRETFIYEGLGFPVKLVNVPMKKVYGEWIMDIDLEKLQLAALDALLHKPFLLNGNELRFIRKFLEMTTTEFGKLFGVSHVAVLKWESGKAHAQPAMDVYIRLYLFDHLNAKDKEFRNLYNEMNLETLSKHKKDKIKPISIDIDEDLKIAL